MCAKQRAGGAAGVQIFVGKADTAVLLCWWVVSNGMRAARVGRARGRGWDRRWRTAVTLKFMISPLPQKIPLPRV